jgi:tetratricopeptide (TPR) repeat protein
VELAGHYAIDYLAFGLSHAQLRSGEVAAALATAERAVLDTRSLGEHGFHVRALLHYAAALSATAGKYEQAMSCYSEAFQTAERLGMVPWMAFVQQGRAQLHALEGNRGEAQRAFDSAIALWRSLDAPARIVQLEHARAGMLEA